MTLRRFSGRCLSYLPPATWWSYESSTRRLPATGGHISNAGYFDDWAKLAEAAATICKAKGWYVTLNPVNSALLARAANRIRAVGKEPTTSDPDILRRRWLPIDLDAVRPAGISSTDEEHRAALDFALTIRDHLTAVGWPEPILADSGNGATLALSR